MACHMRSFSLPTQSHPFVLKAEEELQKLRGCVTSSSSLTYQMILDGLHAIRDLYESINEIICMSSNQNQRWIDQELEDSTKVLDVCSTSKDNLGEIKICIQDLESALRRCGSDALKTKARISQLVKKASKDVKNQLSTKSESIDGDSLAVAGLLAETREITVSLLQTIFSFLAKQISGEKTNKWSLVSRALQKRRIECKEQANVLDIVSLSSNVEELENELECLFRHMIQCRVSFLNGC